MQIAVSGAHATGKSTLIGELASTLRGASIEEESWVTLTGEGAAFAESPDAAEYALLCEHACEQLMTPREGLVLFDRTPADYLAYFLAVGGDAGDTDLVAQTQRAVAELDLVVFVPVESPDRLSGCGEFRPLRRAVDRILREMWMDDAWGWAAPVLEVNGPESARAAQVLTRIGSAVHA